MGRGISSPANRVVETLAWVYWEQEEMNLLMLVSMLGHQYVLWRSWWVLITCGYLVAGVSPGDEFVSPYGGYIHPSHGAGPWQEMILWLGYLHFAGKLEMLSSIDILNIFVVGVDDEGSLSPPASGDIPPMPV